MEARLEQTDLAAVVNRNLWIELATLDSAQRVAEGLDRIGQRARERDRGNESHGQSDAAENEDRNRQPAPVEPGLVQPDDPDQGQPEQHGARAERP